MSIRSATAQDWDRIVEIYNQSIPTGVSTADLSPVNLESRVRWLEEHNEERYPLYVEENETEVRGWCSISPYRPGRMALQHTAEISYYVASSYWGQGVASRLIENALNDCARIGVKTLFGILLDTNEASIALLKKCGFERWGHLPKVADIHGKECGHLYMGKRVN